MVETEKKSRSRLKREMQTLQKLGERLVELSPDQLRQIPLEEELREAVELARKLRKHEARRRQFQYIGSWMRQVNTGPIRKALERIDSGQQTDIRSFKQTEKWRDRLLSGDDTLLRELSERFSDLDGQRIARLVQTARAEKRTGRPPKSARALFRYLKPFAPRWENGDISGSSR
jgi:ribosome-associated protein